MNTTLVIARYKENLKWLNNIAVDYIVYNKGIKDIFYINSTKIKILDNIDTEAYVYLNYIVNNYSNLPEQIIFCQGNPFDHSPYFIPLINIFHDQFADIQPLTNYYKYNSKLHKIKKRAANINTHHISVGVEYYDDQYFYIGDYRYTNRGKELVFGELSSFFSNSNVTECIMSFVGITPRSKLIPICYSAIFSVSKQKILEYPKQFYETLLNKCLDINNNYRSRYSRKIFGWIMEFSWMEMFGYTPNSQKVFELTNNVDTVFSDEP